MTRWAVGRKMGVDWVEREVVDDEAKLGLIVASLVRQNQGVETLVAVVEVDAAGDPVA